MWFADPVTPETVASLISEKTRAVFAELIGNPKLNVVDIRALSALCHANGLPLVIDSTTAAPYLVHPIAFGADMGGTGGQLHTERQGNILHWIIDRPDGSRTDIAVDPTQSNQY